MSTLFNTFATNKQAEQNGVPVQYGETTFTLARMSRTNKKFAVASERALKPYRKEIASGDLSAEKSAAINLEVFCETVLLGWQGLEYDPRLFSNRSASELGVREGQTPPLVPYTKENAMILMTELPDLYDDLVNKSAAIDLFRAGNNQDIAGK